MFLFGSAFFWYKIIYVAEFLLSSSLFLRKFKRKDKFSLRVALCTFSLFAIAFLFPIVDFGALWTFFIFVSIFGCFIVAAKICFDESVWNVLFCLLSAYIVRHMAYITFNILNNLFGLMLDSTTSMNPYSEIGIQATGVELVFMGAAYIISYFLVNWVCFYLYSSKIDLNKGIKLGKVKLMAVAGTMIVIAMLFSLIEQYNPYKDQISWWLNLGYNFLTCIMALQLMYSQFNEKRMEDRLAFASRLIMEEQRQYALVKQNIDAMNIKCHDLKHQLRNVADKRIDSDELDEIEKTIGFYESVVKTGNEALDLILTDKSLLCKEKGILLTCIADGASLSFMRPADIYSLFGNAIENAMESVEKLDESKRNISVFVRKKGNVVNVHIENCYDGVIDMKGGVPVSTKGDKLNHGYGFISMQVIVRRYGGVLSLETEDNVFRFNVLFPETERQIMTEK